MSGDDSARAHDRHRGPASLGWTGEELHLPIGYHQDVGHPFTGRAQPGARVRGALLADLAQPGEVRLLEEIQVLLSRSLRDPAGQGGRAHGQLLVGHADPSSGPAHSVPRTSRGPVELSEGISLPWLWPVSQW